MSGGFLSTYMYFSCLKLCNRIHVYGNGV